MKVVAASRRICATLLLGMACSPGIAATPASSVVVEAVQMPAWVERDGARPVPAYPGMELKSRDQIKTGANSRLLLRTADGSTVKLGENALFKLDNLQPQSKSLFVASMDVLEGAFRFTTDVLAPFRGKREVKISVALVTAGIRGTDLWGKSAPDRQIVCLIEGRVDVTPPGEQPFVMDQPLQFYVRDKGQSQPLAAVPAEQLQQWATETDIQPGRGAARSGGRWKVTLGAPDNLRSALKLYDDIRNAGYPAEMHPVPAGNKHIYNVRVANLPSKAEAEALAASLKGRLGVDEAPRVSM